MKESDLAAINEIYNQAVASKFSTAHTHPISMDERREWFGEHDPNKYPVFVWHESEQVNGWFSFSPYRKGRTALQSTAEISYYVHTATPSPGNWHRTFKICPVDAPGLGFKTLIAILLEPNTASIVLLNKFGFELWGDMPRVAEIDGGEYNHQYYGLRITDE